MAGPLTADAELASQSRRKSAGGRLARAQSDRQERVIAAALELAAERGTPGAIQMRDIADRSGVALGTIYKYYRSKDQILAVALAKWASRIEIEDVPSASREGPLVERAVAVLRHATRSVEREPMLARALFFAVNSSERTFGLDDDLRQLLTEMLKSALGGLDDEILRGFQRILTHVWASSITSWMNGSIDLREVGDEIEFACRWLLVGPPFPLHAGVSPDPFE